jgi:xanthine/CO dehydrogenase XdhC/CoxF family maturation factor
MVKILLQPVNAHNQYLHLLDLNHQLNQRNIAVYCQNIDLLCPDNELIHNFEHSSKLELGLSNQGQQSCFTHQLKPAPLVAVFGGGLDAKPVVAIAAELGWQVILLDPRMGYAKQGYFAGAQQVIRKPYEALSNETWLNQIDAAFVLTHNVQLDADALSLLQQSHAKYIGLLGPIHRTDRVLDAAKLTRQNLARPLANPVGLRLGGELPESIALSMLSEAHAVLENGDGQSISRFLNSCQ